MTTAKRDDAPKSWKSSRYNWVLPIKDEDGGGAVYNAFTGACLDFEQSAFERVSRLLANCHEVEFGCLGDDAAALGGALIAGGFVIPFDFDELLDFHSRAADKATGLPLVITINPTFACNLGCTYCFVGKKRGLMTEETERELIAFVAGQLESSDVPSLNVDWFGGEPLLAKRSMERLSKAFLAICAEKSIPYRAQVITNGTLLNEDLVEQLASWGIDRLQLTLDGNRDTHNVRRPWKGGPQVQAKRSSYDDTLRGLALVIGKFAVRLRVNIDRDNIQEAFALLELFDGRGWLSPHAQFYPYPSAVSDYTDAASKFWSPANACNTEEFYDLHRRWLDYLNARGVPVAGERLYGFPEPTTVACGAVSERGWVVNYDGQLHKCGFDSDTDARAVGTISKDLDPKNENSKYWSTYEPVADPVCRECPALPVCLGGCARDRRDARRSAMASNCEYQLKYEPRIVAQHVVLRRHNRKREMRAEHG